MSFTIMIPKYINELMNVLKKKGYESYLVGGCVRDTILEKEIKDYDITTNCTVLELQDIFKEYNLINRNGQKHNTITIHIEKINVEITSFKHDSNEENTIENDLSHRDLTINAMAYQNGRLIDLFGGKEDLDSHIIKTVGSPIKRFHEDPLRILRALRFSSLLSFSIDQSTIEAIHDRKDSLSFVSAERIKAELEGILCGDNVEYILKEFKDVLAIIIPELKNCFDFNQRNPYHLHDVYTHMCNVCKSVKSDFILRMAALLHDIAKPLCFTLDDKGVGHFYNHCPMGEKMGLEILRRLKFSKEESFKILYLIRNHDNDIPLNKKGIKKMLMDIPHQNAELLYSLVELINADKLDHTKGKTTDINLIKSLVEEIKEEETCMKIKDLKINGYDLLDLGFQGESIGRILKFLLNQVVEEKVRNEKGVLIKIIIENFK